MTRTAHDIHLSRVNGMRPACSTLDMARQLGVSVRSVQRWVDPGRLRALAKATAFI